MNLREKYRPKTLTDLVGCTDFVKSASGWDIDSCPSNILLVGPPGVGKTSAAMALARDLQGEYFDPMNFRVSNASDERGIDSVRELKRISRQKGLGVSRRIEFLDEFESFTAPAQKALRQIMEESHSSCIFILAANDIGPIHSAIRDRCLTFFFNPIDYRETDRLEHIVNAEGMPHQWKGMLPNLIKFTNGSLRQAIDILDSLPKEGDALQESIKRDTQYLNKAALNLMGSDFPMVTAYLKQALESGNSRFGVLKGLRFRAKPLMESEEDWHNFMLTYGEFVMMATHWPDDDESFVEYFIAKMKKNMEK
jgi:DNA polymerase III delta prime subunit